MSTTSKRMMWVAWMLTAVAALPFAGGIMKVMQLPAVVEGFGRIGIPQGAMLPIGIIELVCMLLYLIPRTAVLGTFLLTGYLGGAVMVNIIAKTDFIHALVIGLLVWIAAWVRIPELRALLPLRSAK